MIVSELLSELDFLPLAISQSLVYINVNDASMSEYLQVFGSIVQRVLG